VVVFLFLFAANAPDLDFVPGILIGIPWRFHHGPAHSLLAAILFGLAAGAIARAAGAASSRRFGFLMGASYASHLVLDMMSTAVSVRHGLPFFWPIYGNAVSLPFVVFLDVKRDDTAGGFVQSLLVADNIVTLVWELFLVGLFAAVVLLLRGRTNGPARLGRRRVAPPNGQPSIDS
jgi:hypothetical protein